MDVGKKFYSNGNILSLSQKTMKSENMSCITGVYKCFFRDHLTLQKGL